MIFDKLGIHGFSSAQENAIFASLLSGEPCLLVGPPGVAKTELVNVIGAALRENSRRKYPDDKSKWFDYQVYDASKLNFEDLVGYPSIAGMQKDPPEVTYIPTNSSIWGKHLIAFDELNRCAEDRQGNLFEIIRSRKLHGTPTNNLFIFSTINPFGDTGTVEMSNALVDRHMFFLRLGKFDEMESLERRKVISRVGNVDGVGFGYWGDEVSEYSVSDDHINVKLADIGQEIENLMTRASEFYSELKNSMKPNVVKLIDKLVGTFASTFCKEDLKVQKECSISGRRAAAMLRGILSVRAIELASTNGKDLPSMINSMINTCKLSLPIGIGGSVDINTISKANILIEDTIRQVWPNIYSKTDQIDIDKISEAMNTQNIMEILNTILTVDMNKETRNALFSKLTDKNKYTVNDSNNDYIYKSVMTMLYKLNKSIPNFIPEHIKLEITPEDIKETSENKAIKIDPRYTDIIKVLIDKYKNNDLLKYSLRACLTYYENSITSDDEAIRAVLSTRDLCNSILDAINHHNTYANNSSEKEVEERVF